MVMLQNFSIHVEKVWGHLRVYETLPVIEMNFVGMSFKKSKFPDL